MAITTKIIETMVSRDLIDAEVFLLDRQLKPAVHLKEVLLMLQHRRPRDLSEGRSLQDMPLAAPQQPQRVIPQQSLRQLHEQYRSSPHQLSRQLQPLQQHLL